MRRAILCGIATLCLIGTLPVASGQNLGPPTRGADRLPTRGDYRPVHEQAPELLSDSQTSTVPLDFTFSTASMAQEAAQQPAPGAAAGQPQAAATPSPAEAIAQVAKNITVVTA